MNTRILSVVFFSLTVGMTCVDAQSQSWQTASQNTRQFGMVYAAYTFSKSDSNVSLGVTCVEGSRNAAVYIETNTSVVGKPGDIEFSTISVGKGRVDIQPDNTSVLNAKVTERANGIYLGTGIVGAGLTDILRHNDWMVVAWNYTAPSRPNWMKNLLGRPASKPRQEHVFDLAGFSQATHVMSEACGW